MTKNRIILFASILVAAIGVTVGVLILLKLPTPTTSQADAAIPSRGYVPNDQTVLRAIDGVTSIASIEAYSRAEDGWILKTTESDAKLGNATLENAKCSINVTSFGTQYIDTTQKDYGLSKAYAVTVASGEEGALSEDYIITIPTTQGDADFYSALYNPTVEFIGPSAETASIATHATMKALDGDYTTLLAVRLVATPIGAATETSTTKDGSVGITQTIPAIVIKYRCLTSDFDVTTAIRVLKQLKIDFTSTNYKVPAPFSSSSGK